MSRADDAARRLADALRPSAHEPSRTGPPPAATRRVGWVSARDFAAGTVNVVIGNEAILGVPFVGAGTPTILDLVVLENVAGAMLATHVAPRGWQALTLANGATNWSGRAETAAIRPAPGRRAVLRGVILLGASGVGQSCLTIPSGFRPAYTHYLTTSASGSPGSPSVAVVQATAAGDLVVSTGINGDFLRLDDLTWTLD